jgi:hypothetical protein
VADVTKWFVPRRNIAVVNLGPAALLPVSRRVTLAGKSPIALTPRTPWPRRRGQKGGAGVRVPGRPAAGRDETDTHLDIYGATGRR